MILKTLEWSPDEAGTFIGVGADDDSYFDVPQYATHRLGAGTFSAWFTPKGVSMHDGDCLGIFQTQAQARAICQRHWDRQPKETSV